MPLANKSQAALEFLMTYGWAILVVLVAVGALAYFGVLSPDRFLPRKCFLSAGLSCLDYEIYATGIVVHIRNNLGYDATVNKVTSSGCGNAGEAPIFLRNDGEETFNIPCTLTAATKYSGELNVTYTKTETNIQHVNRGTITGRVQ